MVNLIGQRLGQYEILSRFGEGGMATVFRARQLNIKREVAVKVILPNLASKENFHKRFEKEAQIIASLSNPHIVKVFDYGVLRGFHLRLIDSSADPRKDLYYLVMEMLTGGSLSARLARGPLPMGIISQILDQISLALDYAHGRGLVHRDLKPANVLFDDQGNAFLTDFGIAKLLSEGSTGLTQEGMTMGTPSYMSPEQWSDENLGGWTDIYALGVVLFEMLTGRLPFVAGTPFRVMHMHMSDTPPSVYSIMPNLPANLDQIVQKAMAKEPKGRYERATELAAAFKAAITSATKAPEIKAPEPTATSPMPAQKAAAKVAAKTSRFDQRLVVIGVVVVLVVVALIILLSVLSTRFGGGI